MEPRFTHRNAFTVVGMKITVDPTNNLIPQLWHDFMQRHDELRDWIEPDNCYGICCCEQGAGVGAGGFNYIAAIEVQNTDFIPAGMVAHTVSEADYAVFEHHGPLDRLPQTLQYIHGDWLPHSEFRKSGNQDFELYDARFKFDQPDSVLELWIPITRR